MRKVLITGLVVFFAAWIAGSASATLIQGSLTGDGGGLTAAGSWDSEDTILSWNIDDYTNAGFWTYTYTFTVADDPDISHVIVELSDSFTRDNFKQGTTGGYEEDDPTTYGSGHSNPGLNYSFWGAKWNYDDPGLTIELTIVTDRAPMDGSFYGKGGSDTYALANGNAKVPDTTTSIPEPSTLLLIGAGFMGLAAVRSKFKRV